jgi:hypothetical protein
MSTRTSLAKALTERLPFDWQGALLQAAHRAVQARRVGEPTVDLTQVSARETRWLLWPFVEYGGPTVLFADGGTGKSVLALMMAYSVASGKPLLGNPQGPPHNVLYLDWETDAQTHAERLRAIHSAYAFGADPPAVYYKRMSGSLAESAAQIQARWPAEWRWWLSRQPCDWPLAAEHVEEWPRHKPFSGRPADRGGMLTISISQGPTPVRANSGISEAVRLTVFRNAARSACTSITSGEGPMNPCRFEHV